MTRALSTSGKVLHRNSVVNSTTTYLAVATREVDLEPSIAGVDRARSYSMWFRYSNANRNIQNRIVNISENTGNTNQLVINLIPQDNNTGVNQLLRCQLLTDATHLMYIQSENKVNRNRWNHLLWTYTGSEANTGFEMYLNGIKETSPTRFTSVGGYSGAMNSANLRFKIGNHDGSNGCVAAIKDLSVWNKALSDAEALELFNEGYPGDVPNVSFFADIVAHWPLSSDTACSNNATFDLVQNGTAPSFVATEIATTDQTISFKRVQDINTRYVAFGGLFWLNATTVRGMWRSGTSHVLNGKIISIDFDITTRTASAPTDRITDGSADLRGGSVGIDDNGDVHFFCSRYNGGTDTFINTGMYTSTDGGATFGAIELFATTEARYNFYGKHERGFAAGEFFVPFFEHDGAGNYTVSVFKTTDNWATHSKIQVYSGSTQISEPALLNVGNNTFIMLLRRNDSPYGIFQIVSTDGGATWGTPTLTNLAQTTGVSNCEMVVTNSGKISLVMMDRSTTYIKQSRGNRISSVLASATNWVAPSLLIDSYATDSLNVLGYPNSIVLPDGRLLVTFSAEFSSSRADLYFGIGAF